MKKTIPKPPQQLSKAAGQWWRKVLAEWDLDDAGLLILQVALESFDRMVEAQVLVRKHGVLTPDRFGQLKTNAAVIVERDSRAAMLGALKQLHLDLEPIHAGPGRPPG